MSALLAVAPAGDGAPIGDILLIGGIISAATIALLAVVLAHRTDRLPVLDRLGAIAERRLAMPGWAAIPGIGVVVSALGTFMGAIWDIGIHIDKGRDNGPFGTPAHYPLLIGLVLCYLCGVLAVGMTPRDRRRSSRSPIALPALGAVPVGALLVLAGGGYAMVGFPLDDLWHRIFGQDVTLWGPTHTMFFGGLITAVCGAVVLMAEGAWSLRREPFGGRWRTTPLAVVAGTVFLMLGAHATDEFNWAVPQYRQVWQPLLLAFCGALALVLARRLGGRGAVVATLLLYLVLQGVEVLMIGALGTTRPASVLFVAEALIVALALGPSERRAGVRAGALAGLAVGTLGFAAEYGWSHLAMPLPWEPALLPEGLPAAALAGTAGGILAVLLGTALQGGLADVRRPLALALGATAVVVGLGVDAGITSTPATTATLTLSHLHTATVDGGHGRRTLVADVAVRLSRPGLVHDANWAYVLAWQGRGRYDARLVPGPGGALRSSTPVPIGGTWKSFVRVHKGRTMMAVPIRMPSDPALHFPGYPARRQVTRPLVRDTELLQVERKSDAPLWAWTPAVVLVMTLNLLLLALVGAASVRAGRGGADGQDRDARLVREPRLGGAPAPPGRVPARA